MAVSLGLDIGSNSVGSAWVDDDQQTIEMGVSYFPAGVEELDEKKRGDPKNVKRRAARRMRITLARRAERKRRLRERLVEKGFLPGDAEELQTLLGKTNPWELRRRGLTESLSPHEFGRVLLHMAQRRGALGVEYEEEKEEKPEKKPDTSEGDVEEKGNRRNQNKKPGTKELIGHLRESMLEAFFKGAGEEKKWLHGDENAFREWARREKVTVGRFLFERVEKPADEKGSMRHVALGEDKRSPERRAKGFAREWRDPIRNKEGRFLFHADRGLIRDEFDLLWKRQCEAGGAVATVLSRENDRQRFRLELDDPERVFFDADLGFWKGCLKSEKLKARLDDPKDGEKNLKEFRQAYKNRYRHGGLLFGQQRQTWDVGTLGRCVLEPTERCAPKADRWASEFRVVETVNRLRYLKGTDVWKALDMDEREKVMDLLRGPLGVHTKKGKLHGQPKKSAGATEILEGLGWGAKTGKKGAGASVRLNVGGKKKGDSDEIEVNTDWFYREVVQGAIGKDNWENSEMWDDNKRESLNRALLKFLPDEERHEKMLREGAGKWWGLDGGQVERLVEAWKDPYRPHLQARVKLSRRAIRNLLPYMKDAFVATDHEIGKDYRQGLDWRWLKDGEFDPTKHRWPTEIEARKMAAGDPDFRDCTTGKPMDERQRRLYMTGTKPATSRDRRYQKMQKHKFKVGREILRDKDGKEMAMLPPAPMFSNPVVRKAIHEVRRHVIAWIRKEGRKPDRIVIELARECTKPGKVRDEIKRLNDWRAKLRRDIIQEWGLGGLKFHEQRERVDCVILARQQNEVCPFCGKNGLTERVASLKQDCEIAHILPYSRTHNNGLNNKVLAHRGCNRNMLNQTPREWWGAQFDEHSQAAARMFKHDKEKDWKPAEKYFTKADYAKKWKKFTAVNVPLEWKGSQLSDTAYAARQVAAYLADALYGDKPGQGLPERGCEENGRLIFFTKGAYTSQLRRDWQLYETLKPRRNEETGKYGDYTPEEAKMLARKNRGDHREHAIDAVVIAFTNTVREQDLAQYQENVEKEKAKWIAAHEGSEVGFTPSRRDPLPPPWGQKLDFRASIIGRLYKRFDSHWEKGGKRDEAGEEFPLVISHRPERRRLAGAFHKQEHYGPVFDDNGALVKGLVTQRKSVLELKPAHLRVQVPEPIGDARARIRKGIAANEPGLSDAVLEQRVEERVKAESIERATEALVSERKGLSRDEARKQTEADTQGKIAAGKKWYLPRMVDPEPGDDAEGGKGGIVRDAKLRQWIRQCLTCRGLNPDKFSTSQLKEAVDGGKRPICFPTSGVPIRNVVLVRTNNDPLRVVRKSVWNPETRQMEPRSPDDRIKGRDAREVEMRLYDAQSNHHVEVISDRHGGWSGRVVRTIDAVKIRRERQNALREAGVPQWRKFSEYSRELERRVMAKAEREKWMVKIKEVMQAHPLVNRSDKKVEDETFVMSLGIGEVVYMKHAKPEKYDCPYRDVCDYFVVFKLDRDKNGNCSKIHFKHHWDGRRDSGEKEEVEGEDGKSKKQAIEGTEREDVDVTPSQLRELAPTEYPGGVRPMKRKEADGSESEWPEVPPHALKVRVGPLGDVRVLYRD